MFSEVSLARDPLGCYHYLMTKKFKPGQEVRINGSRRIVARVRVLNGRESIVTLSDPTGACADWAVFSSQLEALDVVVD